MPSKKNEKLPMPSQAELLELLAAAIDGVDGYESEHGRLKYWNAKAIDRARSLLDSLATSEERPK